MALGAVEQVIVPKPPTALANATATADWNRTYVCSGDQWNSDCSVISKFMAVEVMTSRELNIAVSLA